MRTDPGEAERRLARVEARLREDFEPELLELHDESHRHRGHPGAASGGAHLRLLLVSSRFEGSSRMARHRMVYDALEAFMDSEIHALTLQLVTPEEHRSA